MARPRTGRAQAEQEGSGPSGGGQVLPGTMLPWWPCVSRSFVALGSQGRSPGPHNARASARGVRATKRPTIPAPSHLLDKVVKRHHSSTTNIVTLELSNLFVVNEHTDGRQYCTNETQKPNQFAHHSDSGWQSGIAQEKKHSDSDASSLSCALESPSHLGVKQLVCCQ